MFYIGTSDILSKYLSHHIFFNVFYLSRCLAQRFHFSSRLRRGIRKESRFICKDTLIIDARTRLVLGKLPKRAANQKGR